MSLFSIILAAGNGKRMNSKLTKPLHKIGGTPMIDYVSSALSKAGCLKTITVIGKYDDNLAAHLGGNAEVIRQSDTGKILEATSVALETLFTIDNSDDDIIIAFCDMPLIKSETLKSAYKMHLSSVNAATIISSSTKYNCESVFYIFNMQKLKDAISAAKSNGGTSVGDVVDVLKESGDNIEVFLAASEELTDINDRVDLYKADLLINKRNVFSLINNGVTILNPDSVRVGKDVKVGTDTVIYPNTTLEGNTEIGENCVIGPNTSLENCIIGNNTEVKYSVASDSSIGDNTTVGPFAYIRPNSKIGNHIKVGDFVEVKNASIDDGTKISHLTYVGDADVGKRVNFGCGTVIVNYDGINKHRTTIEDDCFIGCNSNLVSPVTLRQGAYTAAGSTITDEVPEYALAIARARQTNKEGWAKGKKK